MSSYGEHSINNVIKQLIRAFSVRMSSYGEHSRRVRGRVEVALQLELLSAMAQGTLSLLSCSPNFPCASITQNMHAKA